MHAAKGFAFTLEALLSLGIIAMILVIPLNEKEKAYEKIYVLQKENDLIKVWINSGDFSEKTIKEDFRKMFPSAYGEISVEGKTISVKGTKGKNIIKSTGFYYKNSRLNEISVKTFI